MNDFQLVALNTWTPTLRATSYTPSGSSRIDYLMVRYRDADISAKQVGMLTDAPYLHSGAYMFPCSQVWIISTSNNLELLRTDFHVRWRAFVLLSSGKTHCIGRAVRLALTMLWDMPLTYMNLTTCTGSSHKAWCIISSLATKCSHKLNLVLQFRNGITMPNYVNLEHQTCTPCSSDGSIFHCFRRWKRCTSGGSRRSSTPRSSSSPWRHNRPSNNMIPFDFTMLFHVLAPPAKNQENTSQKRCSEFLPPPEETAAYVKFIQDNWSGPSIVPPELPVPGVPFNLLELEQVIATIPSTKAVAPGFAPGPLWKSQSMFIAERLMQKLQLSTMVESESTNYPTNMAWCMGMLVSETMQTIYQVGKFGYVGAAKAIGESSAEVGGQEGILSDASVVRNIPTVCLPPF